MNQSFLELQAKDKLKQLRDEGQRSQAYKRSQQGLPVARRSLLRFAVAAPIVLALVLIWAR
jgi:hypothetical protein